MPGTSNFEQWNPEANNQESDSLYAADPQRTGGATVGAVAPSATYNKLFYQLSIFVAALAQALANKGYSPNDGSVSPSSAFENLVGVLTNVITTIDIAGLAPINSPHFTGVPTAPTPAVGNDSGDLATTAFIVNAFPNVKSQNGYFKMPNGLIVQWVTGPFVTFTEDPETVQVEWPIAFPTACLFAVVGTYTERVDTNANLMFQAVGNPTQTGLLTQMQILGGVTTGENYGPMTLAIGY